MSTKMCRVSGLQKTPNGKEKQSGLTFMKSCHKCDRHNSNMYSEAKLTSCGTIKVMAEIKRVMIKEHCYTYGLELGRPVSGLGGAGVVGAWPGRCRGSWYAASGGVSGVRPVGRSGSTEAVVGTEGQTKNGVGWKGPKARPRKFGCRRIMFLGPPCKGRGI
jgi:hypothetical protein